MKRILKVSGLAAGSQPTAVTTLCGQAASGGDWVGLTFNPVTQALVAAAQDELYEVPTRDGGGAVALTRIACRTSSGSTGSSSSACSSAAFRDIKGLLAAGDGRIYIMDGDSVLEMSQSSCGSAAIRSLGEINNARFGRLAAISPSGWLAIGNYPYQALTLQGPGFGAGTQQKQTSTPSSLASFLGAVLAPSSESLAASAPPPTSALVRYHAPAPAPTGGEATSSNGGAAAAAAGAGATGGSLALMARTVITVRVGDRAFVVHRALLAERCGYFKQLLASEGFVDSGAAEVTLGKADPDVFGRLLFFIYYNVLDVPATQLQATVELAGRLLMPQVCELLKPRLLAAACTPTTIIPCLLWAEAHSFIALIPALKAYFVDHCKAAAATAPEQLDELISRSPALAAELWRTHLAARG
ncbi:hypothetical protein GPECTOR_20g525 [Gonium pectorale]|uniref:BTB domain-containing protein n=1 Tax=Gonium pectorale TaxID=33097 RepID=A0A150GIM4_GONPE|nr:hypothetical protein GPECTOR_20g525 [Gonium pectorale]|eukprot:KXZ49668.1 hypothetical protein GPECTOR_20g525 [Gonium pectorale]